MLRLIGLCGPDVTTNNRVGLLLTELGFVPISIVQPMVNSLSALTSVEPAVFTDPDLSCRPQAFFGGRSADDILRSFSGWARTCIAGDAIVRPIIGLVENHLASEKSVVITDIRLDEEAEIVRGNGGQIWHIDVPGIQWKGNHPTDLGIADHADDAHLSIGEDADIASLIETKLRIANSQGMVVGEAGNAAISW